MTYEDRQTLTGLLSVIYHQEDVIKQQSKLITEQSETIGCLTDRLRLIEGDRLEEARTK